MDAQNVWNQYTKSESIKQATSQPHLTEDRPPDYAETDLHGSRNGGSQFATLINQNFFILHELNGCPPFTFLQSNRILIISSIYPSHWHRPWHVSDVDIFDSSELSTVRSQKAEIWNTDVHKLQDTTVHHALCHEQLAVIFCWWSENMVQLACVTIYEHTASKMNLFLRNYTYRQINADPFKADFLRLYTVSPVIMPLFMTVCEMHCLKLGKGVPWFSLNPADIITSPDLYKAILV